MMQRTLGVAALLLLDAATAHATELYKCKDPAGRITYSSDSCDKEGLENAGPIKSRLTILPAESPPPRAPLGNAGTGNDKSDARLPKSIKPVTPAIERLLK